MAKVLVIRAPGTNCEIEVSHGFETAGARPELIHIEALLREPAKFDDAEIIAFPGGFSYGDDVASGRVFAMKLRERLWPALSNAALRGVPMIGICNGFQVMVQVGLLPGPDGLDPVAKLPRWDTASAPAPVLSLSQNIGGRYVCRWVPVAYEPTSVCIWTQGMDRHPGVDADLLPVGHGEGRLTTADPSVLSGLEANGQVAVRYLDNYNGSEGAVAGVCDRSGRIFGLMPHPDRFLMWSRHPYWTRLPREARQGDAPGLRMLRNAVHAVRGELAASSRR